MRNEGVKKTDVLAVGRCAGSIYAGPEAEFRRGHKIGPFVILSKSSVIRSSEYQSSDGVPISVRALHMPSK